MGVPEENILLLIDNDATKARLEGYLKEYIPSVVSRESTLYVYFAGHGAPGKKKGEPLAKKNLKSDQHFTEPPPRFNEASLVRAMEAQGIGRPSTYAPIIQTIIGRGYVRLEERRFIPTELGKTVDKQLVDNFAEIVDVNFTAELENLLDRVADGKAKWQTVVKNFWGPFSKKLAVADKVMKVR